MLFPAICDVIRNLSGVWQLLFPEQARALRRRPAELRPGGRRALLRARAARAGPGARRPLGRGAPTDDRLRARHRPPQRAARASIRELYDLRAERPHLVPTAEAYVAVRAGLPAPRGGSRRLLREYLDAARASGRPPLDQARVVLVGSFCEQPPLGLIKTLERAGCYIVDDDFVLGARFLTADVPSRRRPAGRARPRVPRSTARARPSRYIARGGEGRVRSSTQCRRRGAEGVVFCAAELLRPGAARAADADGRARPRGHPAHELQVLREHGPVPGHPRAGRHVLRFDPPLEPRTMTDGDLEMHARSRSMLRQKEMIAGHFDRLAAAREDGKKSSTRSSPATSPSCSSLRRAPGAAGDQRAPVRDAQEVRRVHRRGREARALGGRLHLREVRHRHAEDRQLGPTGKPLPPPDLLLLSYTGCFTFMKWFELLQAGVPGGRGRDAPRALPGATGAITPAMRDYVVEQLRSEVIPALERVTGKKLDDGPASKACSRDRRAPRTTSCWVLRVGASAGPRPSTATSAASSTSGRSSAPSAGRRRACDYYRELREEVQGRIDRGEGPMTPDGRARRRALPRRRRGAAELDAASATSGRCSPTRARSCVASTYTQVGGLYDTRLPARPVAAARDARRLLPRLLHEPRSADAHRPHRALRARSTRPTASSSTR